jgi:hypothetical protein
VSTLEVTLQPAQVRHFFPHVYQCGSKKVAIKMTKWVVGGSLLLGQIIACLDQQRA